MLKDIQVYPDKQDARNMEILLALLHPVLAQLRINACLLEHVSLVFISFLVVIIYNISVLTLADFGSRRQLEANACKYLRERTTRTAEKKLEIIMGAH